MRWGAVIVAAGRGTRFGGNKQLAQLAGKPLVAWSIEAFAAIREITSAIVVTEPEHVEAIIQLVTRLPSYESARVVEGGATRQQSVYAGLSALGDSVDAVLVHDGARPLVLGRDVRSGMARVRVGRAALLAAPVVDTIKRVDTTAMTVMQTLDRATLWSAQTPQFARLAELRNAHERALDDCFEATDDAALLERVGIEVAIVPVTGENFKVTLPDDLLRAELVLRERRGSSTA